MTITICPVSYTRLERCFHESKIEQVKSGLRRRRTQAWPIRPLHFRDHFLRFQRLCRKSDCQPECRVFERFNCPDTRMILIGGQRSCTACASFRPSMLPGIWMSVNSKAISERDSRISTASSASTASHRRCSRHPRPYRPPACAAASHLRRRERLAGLRLDHHVRRFQE